jgi:hypothetical protein
VPGTDKSFLNIEINVNRPIFGVFKTGQYTPEVSHSQLGEKASEWSRFAGNTSGADPINRLDVFAFGSIKVGACSWTTFWSLEHCGFFCDNFWLKGLICDLVKIEDFCLEKERVQSILLQNQKRPEKSGNTSLSH